MTAAYDGHRVYIAVWPNERIVKVGCTGRRRWRDFANRGASIYALYLFRSGRRAYEYETVLHRWLWQNAELAFYDKADAVAYLGPSGGGIMELHRLPALAMLQALPAPPDGQCLIGPHWPFLSPNWSMPEAKHATNATNELTNGYSPTGESCSFVTPAGGLQTLAAFGVES